MREFATRLDRTLTPGLSEIQEGADLEKIKGIQGREEDRERLEHRCFEDLVICYQERLYNLAFNLLGDREAARDVTQETFLRAFRGFSSFRAACSAYTWLSRIAVNLCNSQLRRDRVRSCVRLFSVVQPSRLEPAEGRPAIHAVEKPLDVLHRVERDRLIREALASLGGELKQVVVLRDVAGFAYEEVAEVLGIPVGTVRSRLHRARGVLRDKLSALFEE